MPLLNMLASARYALFYFRMKILRQLRPAFTCAIGLSLGCVSQQRGASAESSRNSKEFLVYVGTYTGPKSKGIYVSRFTSAGGKLAAPELAAETTSPSFLALHPNRRFLYAANEIGDFDGALPVQCRDRHRHHIGVLFRNDGQAGGELVGAPEGF